MSGTDKDLNNIKDESALIQDRINILEYNKLVNKYEELQNPNKTRYSICFLQGLIVGIVGSFIITSFISLLKAA